MMVRATYFNLAGNWIQLFWKNDFASFSFKLERGYDILDLDCRYDSLNIYDGKGYLL